MARCRESLLKPITNAAFIALLALVAPSCVPDRAAVELECNNDGQCPADGRTYCDLSTNRCVPCEGIYPSARPASSQSGGSSADATAATDAGSSAGGAADTGTPNTGTPDTGTPDTGSSDTSAPMDTMADSQASGDVSAGATCVGNCGTYLGDDSPCNCDYLCAEYDDCCPDYAAVCGQGDDAGSSLPDASSGTDAP